MLYSAPCLRKYSTWDNIIQCSRSSNKFSTWDNIIQILLHGIILSDVVTRAEILQQGIRLSSVVTRAEILLQGIRLSHVVTRAEKHVLISFWIIVSIWTHQNESAVPLYTKNDSDVQLQGCKRYSVFNTLDNLIPCSKSG